MKLEALLAGDDPPPRVARSAWDDVRAFYAPRNNQPAWVEHDRASRRLDAALAVLRTAGRHGLNADQYGLSSLEQERADLRSEQLPEFEVRVSAALLALGRTVSVGTTDPRTIDGRWQRARPAPDIPGTLAKAVSEGSLESWLASIQPLHPEYAALQQALADLEAQAQAGGWPRLPDSVARKNADVAPVWERLAATGDESIETFQARHGLEPTGAIDRATLAALNVPIDERIRQVRLSLERWRWMPDDFGGRHIIVNIPQFSLQAREDRRPVFESRVVVGKDGDETPVFSDEMTEVVFSPYWHIPGTIAEDETLPAVQKDPDYLKRRNIEVVRSSGKRVEVVDPSSVDWSDPRARRAVSFRQRPGTSNALGLVKFLFPNRFDVYIHDTPSVSLFRRNGRAFSHGCIRLQDPRGLAAYVLRDQPEWTAETIERSMRSGQERHVKLTDPIPVHIVYFTAWVDQYGTLHFANDVYGYDKKQAQPRSQQT